MPSSLVRCHGNTHTRVPFARSLHDFVPVVGNADGVAVEPCDDDEDAEEEDGVDATGDDAGDGDGAPAPAPIRQLAMGM